MKSATLGTALAQLIGLRTPATVGGGDVVGGVAGRIEPDAESVCHSHDLHEALSEFAGSEASFNSVFTGLKSLGPLGPNRSDILATRFAIDRCRPVWR